MIVAVTGAGGLLGRSIVRHLSNAGVNVIAMSSTLEVNEHPHTKRWMAEQSWNETVADLENVDAVVHAAAYIPEDHRDPDKSRACLEVNAIGTLNLLRASEEAGVSRFLLISGANILRLQMRPVREDDTIGCEHAPYYLGSKVLAEVYVRSWQTQMKTLILRPSSIYGPGMRRGVFVNLFRQLSTGQRIHLRNGGRFQADFVWRDDVSAVVLKALLSDKTGIVNIGSGEATSLLTLTRKMVDLLRVDPQLIEVEPPDQSQSIEGFSAIDIQRAQQWFGYQPVPIDAGLELWLATQDWRRCE